MKRIFVFFESIIPSKKKWNSWKMPTRVSYIASLVVIITFMMGLFNFKSKAELIQNITNDSGDIIYLEESKEVSEGFNYEFKGRLGNLGKRIFEFDTDKFDRNLIIKIDYTGSYIALIKNSDVANYTGGKLFIEIENCNLEFLEFSIPNIGPAPKNILKQQIEEQFETLIFKNKDLILKRTKLCLKDYL
ncbi:hypothetical protein [Aequorivita xiaoshiensis]|uniref:Uncharacterized protein n=1 Tax=Aequorivita xiaoshiensis TaxID=2874476 RepID=A0A9X1QXG1_9FLAO|nr:hypothetical protein [Aequorivita xiaoshiensis]MCG2430326.1 hypothetical protein [Aequorivita xiaoshiensis]